MELGRNQASGFAVVHLKKLLKGEASKLKKQRNERINVTGNLTFS
jgi:hypothetical protein